MLIDYPKYALPIKTALFDIEQLSTLPSTEFEKFLEIKERVPSKPVNTKGYPFLPIH
jgi:hypothetical protein